MTRKGEISRERIIEAANRLIYIKGYNQTSFADVANQVGITKGNLHYHFKSKDELLAAIIEQRLAMISQHLAMWDNEYPAPRARLKRFVQMLLNEQQDITRYGCPMGSLNVELGKFQPGLRDQSRQMFDLYLGWLDGIFRQLGARDHGALARHLLSMAQGAALLSYVYTDPRMLEAECETLFEWIDGLPG